MQNNNFIKQEIVDLIASGGTGNDNKRESVFREFSEHFNLVSCAKNGKQAIERGWNKRSFDYAPYYSDEYLGVNAGIVCGPYSKVIVLDVDNIDKFKKFVGDDNFQELMATETFVVKTNKGLHIYFMYPDDGYMYHNSSAKGEYSGAYDIRGIGGYVMCPGSVHPDTGKPYTILKNFHPAKAPQWFLEMARNQAKPKWETKATTAPKKIAPIDTSRISGETLRKMLNLFADGERSENEMTVIDSLVRSGFSRDEIFDIFENYPIGEKHREKGESRFNRFDKQYQKAIGYIHCNITGAKADIGDVFDTMNLGDIKLNADNFEFLVEGFWPKCEPMILFGKNGIGKSTFTLDFACELAAPTELGFLNRYKVARPSKVLFVQSENKAAAIKNKIQTNMRLNDIAERHVENIQFIKLNDDIMISADILDDAFFYKMVRTVKSNCVNVVMFDPLVSFHCQDENSNTAMRKVMDRFSLLGSLTNTNVLVVHHDGKGDNVTDYSGGRGASAIGDWARNTLEFKADGKDKNLFKLRHIKASNFEKFGTISLKRGKDLRCYIHEVSPEERRLHILDKVLSANGGEVESQKILTEKYSTYCREHGLEEENVKESQLNGLIQKGIKLGRFQQIKEGRSNKIILVGFSQED